MSILERRRLEWEANPIHNAGHDTQTMSQTILTIMDIFGVETVPELIEAARNAKRESDSERERLSAFVKMVLESIESLHGVSFDLQERAMTAATVGRCE